MLQPFLDFLRIVHFNFRGGGRGSPCALHGRVAPLTRATLAVPSPHCLCLRLTLTLILVPTNDAASRSCSPVTRYYCCTEFNERDNLVSLPHPLVDARGRAKARSYRYHLLDLLPEASSPPTVVGAKSSVVQWLGHIASTR